MSKQPKRIESVKIRNMIDDSPDTSWIGEYSDHWAENAIDRKERGDMGSREFRYFHPATEYGEQDYQRMESFNSGQWFFIGIRAEAEVVVNGTIQRITSPGLWGIESDSGRDYFAEVAQEELAQLRDILAEMGFSARQINAAFKQPETIED